MIEAVSSVISNAPLLRGNAEQVSSAQSFVADEVQVQEVSRIPVAPFLSLITIIDTTFDTAVFARRDSDTGDILRQFPSEERLAQIARQQTSSEAASLRSASRELNSGTSQVSSSINRASNASASNAGSTAPSADAPQQAPSNTLAQSQAAAAAFANTAASAEPQIVSVSISA